MSSILATPDSAEGVSRQVSWDDSVADHVDTSGNDPVLLMRDAIPIGGSLYLEFDEHHLSSVFSKEKTETSYSISLWLSLSELEKHSPDPSWSCVFSKGTTITGVRQLSPIMWIQPTSGTFQAEVSTTVGGKPHVASLNSTRRILQGKWHHVVLTVTNTSMTLWINGKKEVTEKLDGDPSHSEGPLVAGKDPGSGAGTAVRGQIRILRAYPWAMEEADVLSLMHEDTEIMKRDVRGGGRRVSVAPKLVGTPTAQMARFIKSPKNKEQLKRMEGRLSVSEEDNEQLRSIYVEIVRLQAKSKLTIDEDFRLQTLITQMNLFRDFQRDGFRLPHTVETPSKKKKEEVNVAVLIQPSTPKSIVASAPENQNEIEDDAVEDDEPLMMTKADPEPSGLFSANPNARRAPDQENAVDEQLQHLVTENEILRNENQRLNAIITEVSEKEDKLCALVEQTEKERREYCEGLLEIIGNKEEAHKKLLEESASEWKLLRQRSAALYLYSNVKHRLKITTGKAFSVFQHFGKLQELPKFQAASEEVQCLRKRTVAQKMRSFMSQWQQHTRSRAYFTWRNHVLYSGLQSKVESLEQEAAARLEEVHQVGVGELENVERDYAQQTHRLKQNCAVRNLVGLLKRITRLSKTKYWNTWQRTVLTWAQEQHAQRAAKLSSRSALYAERKAAAGKICRGVLTSMVSTGITKAFERWRLKCSIVVALQQVRDVMNAGSKSFKTQGLRSAALVTRAVLKRWVGNMLAATFSEWRAFIATEVQAESAKYIKSKEKKLVSEIAAYRVSSVLSRYRQLSVAKAFTTLQSFATQERKAEMARAIDEEKMEVLKQQLKANAQAAASRAHTVGERVSESRKNSALRSWLKFTYQDSKEQVVKLEKELDRAYTKIESFEDTSQSFSRTLRRLERMVELKGVKLTTPPTWDFEAPKSPRLQIGETTFPPQDEWEQSLMKLEGVLGMKPRPLPKVHMFGQL